MTKEELGEMMQKAYWQGFRDAGKLLLDTVADKKTFDDKSSNNTEVKEFRVEDYLKDESKGFL